MVLTEPECEISCISSFHSRVLQVWDRRKSIIKPDSQKFQLKASSNHRVVSYIKVWACNINNSTEASAYEEIRRVFSFFNFITWNKYNLYICAVEWTTAWIQLCQYKPLCIFALFCSFYFFTMKPLSTTLGHIIYKKWMTQGKADLWYLLCSCPLRQELYSERFRPTLNPIKRSFPCACIYKICIFVYLWKIWFCL